MDREHTVAINQHDQAALEADPIDSYNRIVMQSHAGALAVLNDLLDRATTDDDRRRIATTILRVKPLARTSPLLRARELEQLRACEDGEDLAAQQQASITLAAPPRDGFSRGSPVLLARPASAAARLLLASRTAPPFTPLGEMCARRVRGTA